MLVREIRVGVRKREFCVCERETVVGKGSGSRSCLCVCEREGVSQEGKKNLHRYKERERDMYAMVEARVCGCINLSRG